MSSPLVLARAAEVLVRLGCAFKFAVDVARFRAVAVALHEAPEGLVGPRILSDRPLRPGSLVHYRYGEFSGDKELTDAGMLVPAMTGPDGGVVRDVRNAWFSPPAWAAPPFPDEPHRPETAPSSVLYRSPIGLHTRPAGHPVPPMDTGLRARRTAGPGTRRVGRRR